MKSGVDAPAILGNVKAAVVAAPCKSKRRLVVIEFGVLEIDGPTDRPALLVGFQLG